MQWRSQLLEAAVDVFGVDSHAEPPVPFADVKTPYAKSAADTFL
jgi:hypothetical protein